MKDYAGEEVKVGDTVQFWDGLSFSSMKKVVIRGHVRELCGNDHVIVDLFKRLDNGQTRLTMPANDVLVIKPVIA